MIDRMTRAILKRRYYDCEPDMYGNDVEAFWKGLDPDLIIEAREEVIAGFREIREPTEDAKYKGYMAAVRSACDTECAKLAEDTALRVWRAMIDSILADTGDGA